MTESTGSNVTVVLACHGKPIPTSVVQDAIYGEKSTEPKTVQNLITTTRKQLGRLSDNTAVLAENDRYKGKLKLNPAVKTTSNCSLEALKAVRDPFER